MVGGLEECNPDDFPIAELGTMLNDELALTMDSAPTWDTLEKCKEQLVMGTNYWQAFYMIDGSIAHAKYYHDTLGNGGYELMCYQLDQEEDAEFQYGCD